MNSMMAFLEVGGMQVLLILGVILIFFGGKKLPELARGLGQGIKEFKKATREVTDEVQHAAAEPPAAPKAPSVPIAPVQPAQTVAQSTPSLPGPKA
jgi:sec-independent protein translocase protein TatA